MAALHQKRLLQSNVWRWHAGEQRIRDSLAPIFLKRCASRLRVHIHGRLATHRILSWKMGFQMISAAHYFRIPGLEKTAQVFLKIEVSVAPQYFRSEQVIGMLCEAMEFSENEDWRDALVAKLMQNLCKGWSLTDDDLVKLSEKGLAYILSKRTSGDSNIFGGEQPSAEAYQTFREIVFWQLYQKIPLLDVPMETREKLQVALPAEVNSYCKNLHWRVDTEDPFKAPEHSAQGCFGVSGQDQTAVLSSMLGVEIDRGSFQRLLVHVDWVRIPIKLLLSVIYPLSVIPPPALFQAISESLWSSVPMEGPVECPYKWTCTPLLSSACLPDGQITCKRPESEEVGGRFAVPTLPIPMASGGVYKWQFEIQGCEESMIEVGIIGRSTSRTWSEGELQRFHFNSKSWYKEANIMQMKVSNGNALQCTVPMELKAHVIFSNGDSNAAGNTVTFKMEERFPFKSVVKFQLDTSDSARTCHMSCGEFSANVWENLKHAYYYPIVVIYEKAAVELRLKGVSGFVR